MGNCLSGGPHYGAQAGHPGHGMVHGGLASTEERYRAKWAGEGYAGGGNMAGNGAITMKATVVRLFRISSRRSSLGLPYLALMCHALVAHGVFAHASA